MRGTVRGTGRRFRCSIPPARWRWGRLRPAPPGGRRAAACPQPADPQRDGALERVDADGDAAAVQHGFDPRAEGVAHQLRIGEAVEREPDTGAERAHEAVEDRSGERARADQKPHAARADDRRLGPLGEGLRGTRDVEDHLDLHPVAGVRAQIGAGCERLDHRQADAPARSLVVDGALHGPHAEVAHDHLELAAKDADLHLHRADAARIGVQHDVVAGLADSRLDVVEGVPEGDGLRQAGERLPHEDDVLRAAGKRQLHVALLGHGPLRAFCLRGVAWRRWRAPAYRQLSDSSR